MKDFREIDEFRRRLRMLGQLVGRRPAEPAVADLPPPSFPHDTTDLAPVVSIAEARARRACHPSAGNVRWMKPAHRNPR